MAEIDRIEIAADVDTKRVAALVQGKSIVALEATLNGASIRLDDGSTLRFEPIWGYESSELETTWEAG